MRQQNTPRAAHPTGLSRRNLFTAAASAGALAALGAGAGPAVASGHHEATRVPGIQLYTLRGSMAEDPLATLTAVSAMGYGSVEFAGYHGVPASTLRGWLDDLGLAAPSAHVDPRAMKDDPGPLIEDALVMGHEYLVIAWLPKELRSTADDYRGWAEVLNRAGAAARDVGLRVAYHNHDFEFAALDGTVPQQLLMAETDPALVDFELDFYWVRKAGLDIEAVLGWAPERFTLAHIKDMDEAGEITDVGAGIIDFAGLLANEAAANIRHPFVEHDNAAEPFRTAAVGRYHLSRMLGG